MLSYIAVGALAALAAVANAQSNETATPAQIALVEAQFNASGLDAPIGNGQALGMPLKAVGLLDVEYSNNLTIVPGNAHTPSQLGSMPRLTAVPVEGAALNGSYTVMLADFSAIGNPDPEGEYRHYLANNVQISSVGMLSNGTVITYYATPGPLPGTGTHRYAWLVFQQPSTFAAPANLSTSGVAPGHWDVASYVNSTGLGDLVMANFFTVINGQATASEVATSSVNTATLSIPSTVAAAGATSATAGVGANAGGDKGGSAASSYALSTLALGAVAGAVAILA